MFKNYLTIAWRKIIRNKIYALVNILGLSLGLCACIAIYIIVSYELGFDTFHPDKGRIYRVMGDLTESTGDKLHFCRVPSTISLTGRQVLAGTEAIAAILPYDTKVTITGKDASQEEFATRIDGSHYVTACIAEPAYFNIFRYQWLAGNANVSLSEPNKVVLTESRARQYFGNLSPDKIIGQQVIYQDSLRVNVSGIIKDWRQNTDLAFTDFISFGTLQSSFLAKNFNLTKWGRGEMNAWIFSKLKKGTDPKQITAQMNNMVKSHATPDIKLALWLENITDIHFDADIIENPIRTAHMPTIYGLIAVAIFILILAIINFINLSTALSTLRFKEAGVRKVLGGSKSSLIIQYLTEAFLLILFSVVLGTSLVEPVLNCFRSFIPPGVTFHFWAPSTLLFLGIVTIITSLSTGLYPAIMLSSHSPVGTFRGASLQPGGEKWLLRKGLIVFQFSVSLIFIIGSIVIARQMRFTREKDLGFKADAIINIELPRKNPPGSINVFAQKIKHISGINNVALEWLPPMTENPRGMKLKYNSTDQKDFWVKQVAGDEQYIPLYQLKLLAGRNLVKTDTVNEFVINESLSKMMGLDAPEKSLGKILYWDDKPYPVVGVVADFHTSSLHDPIAPLCIINRPNRESSIAVKLASKGKNVTAIQHVLTQIEKNWKQLYPAEPFTFKFYDETLAALYEKDQQTATLINVAMAITIFISCIGLFGLTLFTAEKRAKEISVRKVLGATVSNIVFLLSKDFVILVIIALFIASPVAWYFMTRWLQDFTYHINIGWWIFLLAGLAAVGIALITVSLQALKAAIANPVKYLRAE
jgi:putative ABC transport system permease protein